MGLLNRSDILSNTKKRLAVLVGSISTGFELRRVVFDSNEATEIVAGYLASGVLAEALAIEPPSSLNSQVKDYDEGNHFVVYGGLLGNGFKIYGPFPDCDSAADFAEIYRSEDEEWEIFELTESTMEVELIVGNGEPQKGVAVIRDHICMVGKRWLPGAVVEGFDPLTDEILTCAIMEGGRLYDSWEEDEFRPGFSFRISRATRQQLAAIDLLKAAPPVGAIIKTEDGFVFTVQSDGTITDADMTFKTLQELDVDFVMECCTKNA